MYLLEESKLANIIDFVFANHENIFQNLSIVAINNKIV